MPLYKGNTKIGAIYKGITPISAIYKGSTLIFSSYTWQEWYVEYVYNTLVPTTINSKNVLDKAKVSTIYGNSVVENQHFNSFRTVTTNGCSITPLSNGRGFHIQGTAQANANTWVVNLGSDYTRFSNHTMFLINNTSISVRCNSFRSNTIGTITGQYFVVDMVENTVYDDDIELQLIDLTQRYPFDTPTTLTDIRVQALLNRGYIPYNTGTLKNVDMSEVSSEPYNLFDGVITIENGYLKQDGGLSGSNNFDISDYIKVVGGTNYTLENVSGGNPSICFYDENKNYISGVGYSGETTINITTPNNCSYVRFSIYKANESITCFHRTGTRTGYAPYVAPQTLSLKYQGSGVNTAHDTMVIDNDNVVFTKNMSRADLGSLTYRVISYQRFATTLTNGKTGEPRTIPMLCPIYKPLANGETFDQTWDMVVYNGAGSDNLVIHNTSYTDINTFKTAMNGVMLEYTLATPQVITIPRKHIGVVDLGSLNWTIGSNGRARSGSYFSGKIKPWTGGYYTAPNMIYCSKYINIAPNVMESSSPTNLSISIGGNDYEVCIYDSELVGLTNEQIQAKLSCQYLYYETTDESTIQNIIGIQSGGTITTNSEVLPNIDFELKAKYGGRFMPCGKKKPTRPKR